MAVTEQHIGCEQTAKGASNDQNTRHVTCL
jgi:hypothetical protein